ncbi:MAG: domain S-box, partial [Armatimonadetes bacterium]|nr:domain S-box [Armatimonadota bacterium]
IYLGMRSAQRTIHELTERSEPSIQAVVTMQLNATTTVAHVQGFLGADDARAKEQVAQDRAHFREASSRYLRLADGSVQAELGRAVTADYEKLATLGAALLEAKTRRDQLPAALAPRVAAIDRLVAAELNPKPEESGPDTFEQGVQAMAIQAETDLIGIGLPQYARSKNPAQRRQLEQRLQTLRGAVRRYGQLRLGAEDRAKLRELEAGVGGLERSFAELFALDDQLERDTPRLLSQGRHLNEVLEGEIQRATLRRLTGARTDADRAVATVMQVLYFLVPTFVLCCMVTAMLLIHLIRTPVRELMQGTIAVASGDLRYRIPRPGRDEFGELAHNFNRMVDQLEATTVSKERLEASEQKLQDADLRKNEFLAMLGHELRNPLGALSNAVHLLQGEGGAGASASSRAIITRQVGNMSRLVDDLLEVSRITRGKVELRKEPMDAVEAARQAVQTALPGIEVRGHQLHVSLPSSPVWVEADALRLEQVITNLLNNAAKYTEPGGEITLTVEAGTGGEALIWVRDNGLGIAPEMLPRVFDLFAQADRSLERSQGGLGIGLTLVRRLVEMHGGTVTAASDGLGKGSEFVVRLPLLAAEPVLTSTPVAPPVAGPAFSNLHPARILVVDDNVDAADTLVEILEAWGHSVTSVNDGTAAIERAKADRPDLVLLDIGLPGMDGYEVARRLRQSDLLAETRLVAVTGYAQAEDRQRSREAGFDAHLVKPLDLDALRELVPDLSSAPISTGK